MIARELTMTIICACGNQFGAWRSHCPACGTGTPPSKREILNTPREVTRRVKRAVVAREPVWHECVFCRLRGAKAHRCPICNQPVHANCRISHEPRCKEFQTEVAALTT